MSHWEYTFPAHALGAWDKSAVYHLEFTFTEEEAREFDTVCAAPGSVMRLIVSDEPEPQATLPAAWFRPPYAWNTLLGIAADLGHQYSPPYGDDGVLSTRCNLCAAGLELRPDGVRERSLIDVPCPWTRRQQ